MPLYEYHCESCEKVFEALRSLRESDKPAPCTDCGRDGERIMPTTFASMTVKQGWSQRTPFHHGSVRADEAKRPIAPVKPKGSRKGGKKAGRGKKG